MRYHGWRSNQWYARKADVPRSVSMQQRALCRIGGFLHSSGGRNLPCIVVQDNPQSPGKREKISAFEFFWRSVIRSLVSNRIAKRYCMTKTSAYLYRDPRYWYGDASRVCNRDYGVFYDLVLCPEKDVASYRGNHRGLIIRCLDSPDRSRLFYWFF